MDFLEDGEFLVLDDESTHMVDPNEKQIRFSPSILRLTNTRVIVEPFYEINRKVVAPLSRITTCAQNVYNECAVLDILCDNRLNDIHVFIPDEKRRFGFAAVLSSLCSASEQGQEKCNECALHLRRRRFACESLDDFYQSVAAPTRDSSMSDFVFHEEALEKQHLEITKSVIETLNPLNLFADFVETAPSLFFALMLVAAAFLTLVFRYISFGSLVCIIILILAVESGIYLTGTPRRRVLEQIHVNEDDARKPMIAFVAASNQVRELIGNRLFWYNRTESLEVCAFMVLVLCLFHIFDPTVLLLVSLLGLAFFERWDPFERGSLPTILSHLILW